MEINDLKNPAIIKNRRRRIVVIAGFIVLIVLGIGIATYPFWPMIGYWINPPKDGLAEIPGIPEVVPEEKEAEENIASLSEIEGNILIIPKIGVRIPIVEGTTESTLNKGAWRLPETSTPDKGSNTVIAGHRWKYRPPSEKTFYLLDKLEAGDMFKIIWQGKEYDYKVIGIAVVLPTDVWVLNPTQKPIVTLITCTPLFSTEKRLVVKGELISSEK